MFRIYDILIISQASVLHVCMCDYVQEVCAHGCVCMYMRFPLGPGSHI